MSEPGERPRVLGVVPVRGGSKGVPRKNIRLLAGKPLLYYTTEAALASRMMTRVVVSTEDDEIARVAEAGGVDVIARPIELSLDTTPTHPVVAHALDQEAAAGRHYDWVFTLQVTTPFRTTTDIDDALSLAATTGAESVIGVVRVFDHHPARIKRIVDGRLHPFCVPEEEGSRRQDLEPAYLRNGAVYIARRDIVDRGTLRGDDQCPFEMPAERSLNIDEPLDLALAELMLRNRRP